MGNGNTHSSCYKYITYAVICYDDLKAKKQRQVCIIVQNFTMLRNIRRLVFSVISSTNMLHCAYGTSTDDKYNDSV